MLTLPIKKKWFDMIKSGEKKEEWGAKHNEEYFVLKILNVEEII